MTALAHVYWGMFAAWMLHGARFAVAYVYFSACTLQALLNALGV